MIELEKLEKIKRRFEEIEQLMADPEVATDSSRMQELGREHGELRDVVAAIRTYENLLQEKSDLEELVETEDGEMKDLAQYELEELTARLPSVEHELKMMLIPKDPEDKKDAIVEIRAGTGGDEAALFAGDLFRLYTKFAEKKGWKYEVMEIAEGTQGGFKEVVFGVQGKGVFGTFKYESGVHRVQRVPETESSGRIHTSAATVAVLPEAEEVDVDINPADIKIDTFRATGPGGQSVNTTDSAVRITHVPTDTVVSCQDEKSQHKNKAKAMRVLRSRLYEKKLEAQRKERDEARRSQVGSGDRSAKIRTYNFPQDRVTDHRLEGSEKNHALQDIIDGDLDPIINALRAEENAERLANL
ncbi:peptide chain release factor 1 [Longibacter salinarum]|uniref:Peptide chain release factor 1 n=1 Tax=Longibacter salinarum TaxID=1850348 RepID=A0A2A8D1K2_9BACT|nr:peptide chain release factor 1 [Longibacter salinarum]PEN14842.1 peptide chain release factor 1 [Longibacter salinarum]